MEGKKRPPSKKFTFIPFIEPVAVPAVWLKVGGLQDLGLSTVSGFLSVEFQQGGKFHTLKLSKSGFNATFV